MLLLIIPDWNSLDSVRRAHSDLEAAGILFFALLVVAEVLAHNTDDEHRKHRFDSIGIWFFAIAIVCEIAGYAYGERNDTLSANIIGSLDKKANDAASKAEIAVGKAQTALTDSGAASSQAADAKRISGEAENTAAMAGTLATGARKEVEDAELRIVEVNRTVSEVSRIAEESRFVSGRLQTRLSDRVITADQKHQIGDAFAPLRGLTVDCITVGDTLEVSNTATAIISSMRTVGIRLNSVHPLVGDTSAE